MSNNILRLTRLHLKGTLGISAGFSSQDDRQWKKSMGILATYVIIGAIAIFLVSAISNALSELGYATYIPGFVAVIAVILIFVLNVFKSGSTIFDLKLFDTEVALPVTSFQIVSSRFLVLYIVNLMLAIVIMVPGLIVCGLHLPDFSPLYVIGSIIGVLLIPLTPLTISTAIGAVLYAISAHMKHRKMIIIILGMVLMVAAFVVYFGFIFSNSSNGTALPASLATMVAGAYGMITGWCIPATLLSEGMLGGILSLVYFVAISIGFYVGLLLLVSWKYLPICQAMQVKDARHNYVMHEQEATPLRKSLFRRDFKRYSSSTTYVFNTLFGYVLMVVLGVAIFFLKDGAFFAMWKEMGVLPLFCAFGLALLASISSTTPAAISIEGKNWWITQTLPVSAKEIYLSKLKVNYVVALPFYLISEILLIIALKPLVLEAIVMIILPLIFIYFMSVFGLRLSIRHPKFIWDYETEAVKQGTALILSIVIALGSVLLSFAIVIVGIFFDMKAYTPIFLFVFAIIILVITVLMHRKMNKIEIIDIV